MSKFQEEIAEAIKAQDLYFVGEALPPDWYAGFKLWHQLAEGGDVKAMVNVGYCLVHGQGADKNANAGLDWYRRAADLGDTRAMLCLYAQTKTRQPTAAEEFLQRAVAAGDERAISTVNERAAAQERQAAKEKADQQRATYAKRSAAVVAEVKQCLARQDLEGARRCAEKALQDGLPWAGAILAAMAVRINVRRMSRKTYTRVQGSSTTVKVGPTYVTTPNMISGREYDWKGEASNPSQYPVLLSFKENYTTYERYYRLLVPGGTLPLLKSGSPDKKWPTTLEVILEDPAKTHLEIPAPAGQVARRGGRSLLGKIVGWAALVVALLVVHRVWELWRVYQILHPH
ncbi:tetratricopeptide repeat protein [Burkholderia gladioli]|uniref:tetratricopeptide repeat protein n=1 Tax=Burkholderia gladioli TaxID=28095 RepID=UPI00163E8BD4|nr:sel1 repeat family protein [Burkholderia gladioli]